MERVRKLKNHPVVLILLWLPTIALLPGDWITIGGAVTSSANLTRLVLGMAGLLAILWVTDRLPRLGQETTAQGGAKESSTVSREQAVPEPDSKALFVAAEGEIALAYEEALEMAKLLRKVWPFIGQESEAVEAAIPDWHSKTAAFVGVILGPARRAAFKGSDIGANVLERLESQGRFLNELGMDLTPESLRVNEVEFLSAREKRRDNRSARFLAYDQVDGSSAPPKASAPEKQELIDSMQFPRRNDREEWAARSERLAAAVERWVRHNEKDIAPTVKKMFDEVLAVEPEREASEVRRRVELRDERNRETDYALRFRAEAKEVFDKAYEFGEISKGSERLAVQPFSIEFNEVPALFRAIAYRLDDEVASSPPLAS